VSTTILDRIVASKRRELAAGHDLLPEAELQRRLAAAPPPRDFRAALCRSHLAVIAELKRASPAAGLFAPGVDLLAQARTYAENGAAAISVLTDGPFFHGALADLEQVRAVVDVPLLRKDFILDRRQVLAARAAGADACLLIAEILDDEALVSLRQCIEELGMAALVECYEPANLERVMSSGAKIIGINNRDLRSFAVRLEHTLEWLPRVPKGCLLVSESGIRTGEDAARLAAAGVRAVLVGEALMRSTNVGALLRDLQPPLPQR